MISGSRLIAGETMVFQHELIDDGNGYNPSTGVYTVPVTGRYRIIYSIAQKTQATASQYWLMINNQTTPISGLSLYNQNTNALKRGTGSAMVNLNSGDRVYLKLHYLLGTNYLNCYNYSDCRFSGFLLY